MADHLTWAPHALIDVASPVLAVTTDSSGTWVGGTGGLARLAADGTVDSAEPAPVRALAALYIADGWLIAGGAGGIARRHCTPAASMSGRWDQAHIQGVAAPVTAITGSSVHDVLLAATLTVGVLRSSDRGRTWLPSNFGLPDGEVTDVAAGPDGTVLAATEAGLYWSRNGGRAWRPAAGTERRTVAAVRYTDGGVPLAAFEEGGSVRSGDGGVTWQAAGGTPPGATTLLATHGAELLLGTADSGVWRSTDHGSTWRQTHQTPGLGPVFCLAAGAGRIYAGTGTGLTTSRDAVTWQPVPVAPTHDLDQLHTLPDRIVVTGPQTGVVEIAPDGTWRPLPGGPFPLTCAAVADSTTLFASGPDGLYRRTFGSRKTWQQVIAGERGHLRAMTYRPDGAGWALPAGHGREILRTGDHGLTWQSLPAPFGAVAPATVTAGNDGLVATRVDSRHGVVEVWCSSDDGETWHSEARAETRWPVATLVATPPLAGIGRKLFARARPGVWVERQELSGGIRVAAGGSSGIAVLTTDGLWHSADSSRWTRARTGIRTAEIVDLCVRGEHLYALMAGGRVLSAEL